ncbi:MAG: hypothetical protein Q4G52_01750, partial [Clostridia bacterium]|nr:hypothetical protein [Clostridia bacterium]
MKRVIGALLCIMLLWTSAAADAGETTPGEGVPCEHANGTTTTEQRNVMYAQSAATHTKSYSEVKVHTCPDCKEGNYEEVPAAKTDAPEAHRFENGVCTVCGYACQHAAHGTDGVCVYCGAACVHSYAGGICSVCGAACVHPSYSDGRCTVCGVSCIHRYENSVCTVCGYACQHSYVNGVCEFCGKNECEHTGLMTTQIYDNRRISGSDEKYHYMTYDLYMADYCGICQRIVGEKKLVQADCESRENHYYLNGENACYICGHVSECTHEVTEEQTYWAAVEVLGKDENGHQVRADLMKDTVCLDCGKHVKVETLESGIVITESHGSAIVDGTCYICGYTMAQCDHPETEKTVYYDWTGVVSKDESGHTMKGTKVTETRCLVCGDCFESVRENDQTVTEPHNFYLDRCADCGYINPCKHEKTHTETGYSMTYDYTATAQGHTFKGCKLEQVWCEVCESCISEEIVETNGTYTELHDFDETGVCVDCGYKETVTPTPAPTAT